MPLNLDAFLLPVLAISLTAVSSSFAQEPASLRQRLEQTSSETNLDQEGLLPWHLKLDVKLLQTSTQKAGQGTIEMWWQNPKSYRIQYVLPDYNAVYLRQPTGEYRTADQDSPSLIADSLLNQAIHPLSLTPAAPNEAPELRSNKFGKIALDCIMLSKQLKPNGDSRVRLPPVLPLGLFPTYCLNPGTSTLRVTFSLGSQAVIRNSVGVFQKKSVSTETALYEGASQVAVSHATSLRSEAFPANFFEPSADLTNVDKIPKLSGGVLAGTILKKTPPIYPESAKQNHLSGLVVLHAIIGRDGHIHQLEVMSAPDGDLALASLDAVRTWVYKPYLLNGRATEVDSTITVNFAFGN